MKKIIFLIIPVVLLLILFGAGCEKELESKVFDQLAPTNFPMNEADIKTALIPFYTVFNTYWGNTDPGTNHYMGFFNPALHGYDWFTRNMTDESISMKKSSSFELYTFGPASQNSSDNFCFYNKLRFIARATDILDKISDAPVTDDLKAQYGAEAKAMRAWYMFILYDLYGPLNPKLDPAKLTDLTFEPRLSKEDYVNFMVEDLTSAIPLLSDKFNNTSEWGKISQGVASMILLKIYLHEKDWENVKIVGTELMGMGYSLLPNYKDVFIIAGNNEVIYAVPGNPAVDQFWYEMVFPPDVKRIFNQDVNGGWGRFTGMPWDHYDKYSSSDTRLQTISDSYVNKTGDTISRDNGLKLAIPMKYTIYVANNAGFDLVMYRYSDVLLSMAEAESQLNGPTQTAIDYVKQVTDRANTIIPASATASKESFNDFLLDERGRELYFEFGNRRQDEIRHGKLISNAQARGISEAKDHMVLLAIPQDVVDESNGIVTQNPGF